MACPQCHGRAYQSIGDDLYACASRGIVNAVPPGQGGNHGVTAIPIYDVCPARFTAAAYQRMDELLAERERSAARSREAAAVASRERARVEKFHTDVNNARSALDDHHRFRPAAPGLLNPFALIRVGPAFVFLCVTGFIAGFASWGAIMALWHDPRTDVYSGPVGGDERSYAVLM